MPETIRKKNSPLIATVVVCLMAVAFLLVLTGQYDIILLSADDVIFERILSGSVTGEPSPYCYYLSYPLTLALSTLYRHAPGIHWYELFLFNALMLCFAVSLRRIVQIKAVKQRITMSAAFFVIILVSFSSLFFHLEWTTTAGALAAAALFNYLLIDENAPQAVLILDRMISAVLMWLAYMIRSSAALMFLPLFAVLIGYDLIFRIGLKELKSKGKYDIAFILVTAALIGAVFVSNSLVYRAREWQDYKAFNHSRSVMVDYNGYPDYDKNRELYDEANMSRSAYELITKDYNYIIPFGFSERDAEKAIDITGIAEASEGSATLEEKLEDTLDVLLKAFQLERIWAVFILSAVLLVIALYMSSRSRDTVFIVGCVIGWTVCLFVYLAYEGRLPQRVAECIEMGAAAGAGAVILKTMRAKKDTVIVKRKDWVEYAVRFAALLLCCVVLSSVGIRQNGKANERERELSEQHYQIARYCRSNPENIYLRDFNSFSQQGKLYQSYEQYYADNYLPTGGWLFRSPVYQAALTRLGAADLMDAVRNRQNLYYLVNAGRTVSVMKRLDDYLSENGTGISMELYGSFPTNLGMVNVLRFVFHPDVLPE